MKQRGRGRPKLAKETAHVSIVLPAGIVKAVAKLAKDRGVTWSAACRIALRSGLFQQRQKEKGVT